jgi:hypothetical protein
MVLRANLGLAELKGTLFDEEPNRQALQELEVAAADHEAADREIAIIDKNGHKAWCLLSVRHVVGEQPLSMWSLADTDVRNAVEAAIDAEQGHFVHANATFAEWLGTTLENLIGGGKRLQEYLVEGSQGGGAPRSLLLTQEAIGCAKVDFVAGDGRTV